MARVQDTRKMRNLGRTLLTNKEKTEKGLPWNEGKVWAKRRADIAARVARKQGIAHEKALIRKEKAKK